MTPEKWEQITEIYHSALDLEAGERKAFLEKMCAGDESLRREVESLLSANSQAGTFIAETVIKDIAPFLTNKDALSLKDETLGHYEILSRIGAGGMGEVYLAKDTRLNRPVALKTLPLSLSNHPDSLRRLKIEAQAAATLNHPNVAIVYSVEEIGGHSFFTMEYVEGKPLDEFIPDGGLDLETFLEWFIQISAALAHAHEKGVVHRDVKPGNIMITADRVPKVLDFGLAQFDNTKTNPSALRITFSGQIFGTPSYMSPEQADGKQIDFRSDIFSLGVVMYEAITGERPFQGESYASVVSEVLTKNLRPVIEIKPETPFMLARLITRCLEKEPRKRFGSMREVQTFLEEIQAALNFGVSLDNSSKRSLQKPEKSSIKSVSSESQSFAPPETHYAQSGDVNIAYQTVGEGDLDVVFVMGWVSHLEYFWKEPRFAAFLNRLAGFSRLILFDKRGTGLSDRVPIHRLPTLEQRMDDVRCVMDAVGSKKAALIGVSEGGPMCSLFAATYPEKTTALVMIGTYAKRIKDEGYPWGVSREQREAFFDLMRRDWGKAVGIEERAPSLANDADFRSWWATYLRMGASPGAAVALTEMNAEIDVRNVLPSIRVPSLVIHRKGDLCLKVEEGRFVADLIPGSKYVELDGSDHLPFVGDQNEILDEIEEFLTGVRHADEYDRVLATVMSMKIVDLEATAREITNWEELMARSGTYVSRQIELFKGRKISFDENGLLATFDGPARAIRCAQTINDSARRFNISVKTGLHTGECDVVGDRYGGVAVRLAKEIAEESQSGEILVSRTVKDLVAGSGLEFREYAVKSFAEVPGEWLLFSVKR
ncbi:MAG TPA: alpha/beta fold hydrolase [Pyrinomonadaceae bacterium]|jgi:serine/threonine protein kinase/class 3 adenylate cyclase